MALLKIAQVGHPVLRERARELTMDELGDAAWQSFIDDLVETMRDANGAGLAANQVHNPVRICAIEVRDNPRYPYKPNVPLVVLVNPVLTRLGTEQFQSFEGCLSVPDLRGALPRHAEIRVDALDRHGNPFSQVIRGITAGTFQHELDHLDGVLFLDRVEDHRTLCTWAAFSRYFEATVRAQVERIVARYGS